jgi:hypothetical protein
VDMTEPWRRLARCALDAKPVSWFYPENHSTIHIAEIKDYCGGCEVRTDCLQAALTVDSQNDHGWWGGTSSRERRRLRARRPLDATCGTGSGYRAHLKAGETPCDVCVAARVVPVRNTLAKPKARKSNVKCGTPGGYAWHRRRREQACDECLAANAAAIAEFRRKRQDGAA